MSSYWRRRATSAIAAALYEAHAAGMSPDEALVHVDAAYPFGKRRQYPYEVWLNERRRWVAVSPLLRATRCAPPPETRGARARPTVAVSPEQAVLL